jgi:hypothetical protein
MQRQRSAPVAARAPAPRQRAAAVMPEVRGVPAAQVIAEEDRRAAAERTAAATPGAQPAAPGATPTARGEPTSLLGTTTTRRQRVSAAEAAALVGEQR